MAEFNEKTEAFLLATMTYSHDGLTRAGMDQSAAKLYDAVNVEWCKLSPQQSEKTATALGAALLKDGNGNPAGVHLYNDSIVFHCLEK